MKTGITAIISLAIGLFIGWYCGGFVLRQHVQEKFAEVIQKYPPGFFTSLVSSADEIRSITKDEFRDIISYAQQSSRKSVEDCHIQHFYNGVLALRLQQLLDQGETNIVQDVLRETIQRFAQRFDGGDYMGTHQEEAARELMQRWRNQTNSPTVGRIVPPSAGAPGGQ